MHIMNRKGITLGLFGLLLALLLVVSGTSTGLAQTADDCLGCHDDASMESMDGKKIGVIASTFQASVHGMFDCIDCHSQAADWDDIPHFDNYRKVDCSDCHDEATDSYRSSFHGTALAKGVRNAPDCASCHGTKGDPHTIHALDLRSAENSCRMCHSTMADRYDTSVHTSAAKQGKDSPGCVSCHPTHASALPPSVGAINNLCESCHKGTMEQIWSGEHKGAMAELKGQMSCASCHDVHATHKPEVSENTFKACATCHPGYVDQFSGSVHEGLIGSGAMNCVSCHRTHQVTDATESENLGCGACHVEVEEHYRSSAHRLARLRGDEVAADCADCHDGHHVLHATDPESRVNRGNIPETCGECHGNETVITSDYVRLPISLPNYSESVHGQGHLSGNQETAVCTDCHGTHDLQSAAEPSSMINKRHLAQTCGQCHQDESNDYMSSVHGRAVAHGIDDSPSCTDCHDEHLILPPSDPRSTVSPEHIADVTCAKCHEDPEMAARYGLPQEVIESYQDSYHGWAVARGGQAVANCVDCHNVHDIRSRMDPTSSIHPDHVVDTCGKCHPQSNAKFAASYSHILARDKMMVHDYVRIIYIVLITVVLGGMALHNIIVYIYELRKHYRKQKKHSAIRRMTRNEVIQHMLLFISFSGLAISGFALRFPDAWWVKLLSSFGMTEESRRLFHRGMAVLLVGASVYHVYYLAATNRGRMLLKALFPRVRDIAEAIGNVGYYIGLRKKPVTFGMYDYTQKAEYWALIWGTAVMGLTGLILWFPALVTSWLPAWVVRVSETIHYYEAILAVSAIVIWHFFFTIILPKEYPMSFTWIDGEMPKEHWEEHHGLETKDTGVEPDVIRGELDGGDGNH